MPGDDVPMLNVLSIGTSVMLQSMLFSDSESLVYNLNHRQRDLKPCEFSRTYYKVNEKFVEKSHLVLLMTGNEQAESRLEKGHKVAFFDLAAKVQLVLDTFRVQNVEQQELVNKSIFDYSLTHALDKKPLVSFGQIKDKWAKRLDIKQTVFYADFVWALLLKQYTDRVRFVEVSKFFEVRRDSDKDISFGQIKQTAQKYERELSLQAVHMFDDYEGENIGADKSHIR